MDRYDLCTTRTLTSVPKTVAIDGSGMFRCQHCGAIWRRHSDGEFTFVVMPFSPAMFSGLA